jgi:transposase
MAASGGQPPFDPVMMTALLLYSYCCGIYSLRRIAKAYRERVDFMSIVGSKRRISRSPRSSAGGI